MIPMSRFCPRCGEALHNDPPHSHSSTSTKAKPKAATKTKVKRGPSEYNIKYKKKYAQLKKKHPRMKFAALAKKAHKQLKK